jgi:recombination protein RecA
MAKLKILSGRIAPAYKLPTGSYGLNKALNGGLQGGRVHVYWGAKASGKTTQALMSVAEAQRLGKTCMWIDAEKTYDSAWAEKCGVDIDSLLVIRALSVEDILTTIVPMIRKGEIDVVVIDSLSTVSTDAFFDDPTYKGIGTGARATNILVHKILEAIDLETQVICIAHANMAQAGQGMSLQAKISKSVEHWASTIVMFRLGGSKDDTRSDGAKQIYWDVKKSKQSLYPVKGQYWFCVTDNAIFIDQAAELVTAAVEAEIIERKGAWYRFDGDMWQGEAAVVSALKTDNDLRLKIEEALSTVEVVVEEEENE